MAVDTRVTALLVGWLCLIGYTLSYEVPTEGAGAACALDDDGVNPGLEACLQKGQHFVEGYLRALRKNRHREPRGPCQHAAQFLSCVRPYLAHCPDIRHALRHHWVPVIDHVTLTCDDDADHVAATDCFEKEYAGLLAVRCDAMYKFNREQNTKDKCHFLRETVNCKDALVTSACSDDTGLYAHHLFRLQARDFIERKQCHVPRDPAYQGFRYTDRCPRGFLPKMAACADKYILGREVAFLDDNDLVAQDGRKKVKQACRDYHEFEKCIEPYPEECPLGLDLVYSFDSHLRRYALKMNYICGEAKEEYLESLPCYQGVLRNGTLFQCNKLWNDLAPLLQKTSSHQFYCAPDQATVQNVKTELTRLRMCYEEVFEHHCDEDAADVLGKLIQRAFRDPFYLRLTYQPDCGLHASPPTPAPADTPTPHHRHSTPRTPPPPPSPPTSRVSVSQREDPQVLRTPVSRQRVSSAGTPRAPPNLLRVASWAIIGVLLNSLR